MQTRLAPYTLNRNRRVDALGPTSVCKRRKWNKAACVWLNGTLGLITYWINSNRSQSGRGGTTVTAIPNIPVLDVARLDAEPVASRRAASTDDLCLEPMLPANEAWRDPSAPGTRPPPADGSAGTGRRGSRAAGNPAQPVVPGAHGDGNQAHWARWLENDERVVQLRVHSYLRKVDAALPWRDAP